MKCHPTVVVDSETDTDKDDGQTRLRTSSSGPAIQLDSDYERLGLKVVATAGVPFTLFENPFLRALLIPQAARALSSRRTIACLLTSDHHAAATRVLNSIEVTFRSEIFIF